MFTQNQIGVELEGKFNCPGYYKYSYISQKTYRLNFLAIVWGNDSAQLYPTSLLNEFEADRVGTATALTNQVFYTFVHLNCLSYFLDFSAGPLSMLQTFIAPLPIC